MKRQLQVKIYNYNPNDCNTEYGYREEQGKLDVLVVLVLIIAGVALITSSILLVLEHSAIALIFAIFSFAFSIPCLFCGVKLLED